MSPSGRLLGRLVQSADFERLRQVPAWSRSVHFAAHHLATEPWARRRPGDDELSTAPVDTPPEPVDDLPGTPVGPAAAAHWLGIVVPKRLARRAVTRNLLRRQIRAAVERHRARLPAGLWVVRLRAAFAPTAFVSAASDALRHAAHDELDRLLSAPASEGGRGAGRRSPSPRRRAG